MQKNLKQEAMTKKMNWKNKQRKVSRVGKGESHPFTSHRTVREPLNSYGSYHAVNSNY